MNAGLREGRMKKEKYQGEPRCVFFSDKGEPVGKNEEETSQLKRKKIIVKERTYIEKK